MKRIVMVILLLGLGPAWGAEGLLQVKSPHGVSETLDRFEQAVRNKGMTVFTRIDHAAGAARVGKVLRPTELLIFGNPNIGTLLMQSNQTAAIDLPMKALAWKDAQGQVWLAWNDPAWIARRHGISDRDAVVAKMQKALRAFGVAATRP
ncbi:MAG TPA: DUF302 domain-containing protein [Gammaproteobacteria bacterium]|nr:DUF302 domain-containing protein [Gammaproteobacteria bacterium]